MMKSYSLLLLTAALIVFSGCKKEDPMDYPDYPKVDDPKYDDYAVRRIKSSENWVATQWSDGCNPNTHVSNLASYELNYSRGFATIHLIPDSSTCSLDVSLRSDFTDAEHGSRGWDDLVFEFTFAEYQATPTSELVLSLYYDGLELDVNLVPYLEDILEPLEDNGQVTFRMSNGEPLLKLNGEVFTPEFDTGNGDHFSLGDDSADEFVQIRMTSDGTTDQSLLVYKYLRIYYYGIPDA